MKMMWKHGKGGFWRNLRQAEAVLPLSHFVVLAAAVRASPKTMEQGSKRAVQRRGKSVEQRGRDMKRQSWASTKHPLKAQEGWAVGETDVP